MERLVRENRAEDFNGKDRISFFRSEIEYRARRKPSDEEYRILFQRYHLNERLDISVGKINNGLVGYGL